MRMPRTGIARSRVGRATDVDEPSLVELTLRNLINAIEAGFKAVPCCCDSAYYDRRLIAPECRHHDLADEFRTIYPCGCEPCKRTESWRPT